MLWPNWYKIYNNSFGALDPPSIWISDWSGQYVLFGIKCIVHFVTSFGQHSRVKRGSFWRCLLRSALSVQLALTRWAAACVWMSGTTSLLDSAAWQPALTTHPTDRMCPPAAGRFLWRSQSCIKDCFSIKDCFKDHMNLAFCVWCVLKGIDCVFSSFIQH